MDRNDWHVRFAGWQAFSTVVRARGERIDRMIQDRGWAIAASVGIDRNACCVHNASIDDDMTGWCAGRPDRLKAAKRAAYLINQYPGSAMAQRIISRAWDRMLGKGA